MITKPMLAASVEDVTQLRFPLLASPKLDGIRCLVRNGEVLSRSFKPIPNTYVREYLQSCQLMCEGFDGELMLRQKGAAFQDVSSAIMSRDGEPDFIFYVFDLHDYPMAFKERYGALQARVGEAHSEGVSRVRLVKHTVVYNCEQLTAFEDKTLDAGFEGVMLRDPAGPYKAGRSTLREGYLLKLKRFTDAEAVIVGFEEQEQNTNEQTRDELGRAKRSTHQAGKVGKGTLGAFIVQPFERGEQVRAPGEYEVSIGDPASAQFRIGTGRGLTAQLRQQIWDNPNDYYGKIVKYRYQEVGTKDAPRIPVWLGFRDEADL